MGACQCMQRRPHRVLYGLVLQLNEVSPSGGVLKRLDWALVALRRLNV